MHTCACLTMYRSLPIYGKYTEVSIMRYLHATCCRCMFIPNQCKRSRRGYISNKKVGNADIHRLCMVLQTKNHRTVPSRLQLICIRCALLLQMKNSKELHATRAHTDICAHSTVYIVYAHTPQKRLRSRRCNDHIWHCSHCFCFLL